MYSIVDRESFEGVSYWMKEIKTICDPEAIVILVGNKCDLENKRVISTEEGKDLALHYTG